MKSITQRELKGILHYDPDTGDFHRIHRAGNRRAGCLAGTISSHGYVVIKINRVVYKAHHLAWLYVHGELPTEIDHINRTRHDNRIENLRSVTRAENMKNKSIYLTNTSGVTGVSFYKRKAKYVAYINRDGRRFDLGYFDTLDEASSMREDALRRLTP